MDFLDLAKKRYSVRSYREDKVPADKVMQILEAGRIAPTGCNRQPQRLIVVESDEGLSKVGKAADIFGAPLAIVVCVEKGRSWVRPYDGKSVADIDVSIVTDHMMLMATELGLGSVWICYFEPQILRAELNIPDNWEPVNILAVGYEKDEPSGRTKRRPLSDLAIFK